MNKTRLLTKASLLPLIVAAAAHAQEVPTKVKAAHENQPPGSRQDDLGITIPIPTNHPGRRYPADHEFPTGPEIGERLPEFQLPNQNGELIDFHADRGDAKAVVVFYRSAVW